VRTLADLPWAGIAVHLRILVRQFFCDNATCRKAAAAVLVSQLLGFDQGRAPPGEVYQGKRRLPQPERWRERMEAAAEAGVARR
jgi:hypothetical protein